jgi:hypothetical protein
VNSGGIKCHSALKKQFHQEIVKGLGNTPRILLCNFAQGREYWDVKYPSYCKAIIEDMPEGVQPSFELAMPADFIKQCKRADVIYFHGGDGDLLHYWMRQFDVPAIFKDKVVATNSASSDLLATSCWTNAWRQCRDGPGILPMKFIPHYQSDFAEGDPRGPIDYQKAYDELAAYGDTTLPIHALKEGEYMAIFD